MKASIILLLWWSVMFGPPAYALPLRVDFAGTFTEGPLTGEGYTGWFTYETAGAPVSQSARPAYFATRGYAASSLAEVSTNPDLQRLKVVALRRDELSGEIVAWALGWEFLAYPELLTAPLPAVSVSGYAFFQPVLNPFLSSSAFAAPTFQQSTVPEPDTFILVVLGVGGILMRRQRSR